MVFKWRDNYTEEFLNLYKSYEYLWNSMHPLYKNRVARESAYKEIIENLKLPNLTIRDVKNKIKTIRTNYKYELNKVVTSQKDALHPSDVYVPRLFWFKKADEFLREFSMARELNSYKMDCSEDDANNDSHENTRCQSEDEGFEIKLENQSSQEEKLRVDEQNSHSSSPVKFLTADNDNAYFKPNPASSENQLSPSVTIPTNSPPPSSNGTQNMNRLSHKFKAHNLHRMTDRQFRKYNVINSNLRSRGDKINRSRQLTQLEEKISSLQRTVDLLRDEKEDEFDLFGKSIALQLRKMPLERAFICQENLQRVINEERLRQNRLSTHGVTST